MRVASDIWIQKAQEKVNMCPFRSLILLFPQGTNQVKQVHHDVTTSRSSQFLVCM